MGKRLSLVLLCATASGAAQSQPAKLAIPSPAGWHFGHSLALAGDIDGDGLQDLVVGRDLADHASVHRSSDGATLLLLSQPSPSGFGESVAGGSDLDGDGIPDVVVSTVGFSVIFGEAPVQAFSGVDGHLLWAFAAPDAVSWDGMALALVPDLDDDGTDDVVAGNRLLPPEDTGRVVVLDGQTGALLHELVGEPGSRFGESVAALGDLDGDGAGDFAIGAPEGSLPDFGGQGYVRLVSGRDAITLGNIKPLTMFEEELGRDVCAAGDQDGDGVPDLGVGIPDFPGSGPDGPVGVARLHSGADKSLLLEVEGTIERPIGNWVRCGADLDADGRQDVALGIKHTRVVSGADGHDLFSLGDPMPGFPVEMHHPLLHPDTDGDGAADVVVGLPDAKFGEGLITVHGRGSQLWDELGGALAGAGPAPGLQAKGWLEAGQGVSFTLTGALPFAAGALVGGLQEANLPFHGGTLVPSPDAAFLLVADAGGVSQVILHWPLSVETVLLGGQRLTVQAWLADATGPDGLTASGALARWIQ